MKVTQNVLPGLLLSGLMCVPAVAAAGVPKGPKADAVPQFDALDLDGRRWNLATMKGRVTLLEFWGTWCVGCAPDHKRVGAFYSRCHERGLDVLGLVYDSIDIAELRRWVKDHAVVWPQVYGGFEESSRMRQLFEPQAFPSYILIERNGSVFATHGGPLMWENDRMLRRLEELCGTLDSEN